MTFTAGMSLLRLNHAEMPHGREGLPEVPEAIPLSSGLSSVAAVMPSPSLAHGEVAASPVPLTCRLLDPGSGGSSQLRRGTVSTWDTTE